ncbi:hypothetical protein ACOSQ4_003922 [Xanthoceras sorbifolium]
MFSAERNFYCSRTTHLPLRPLPLALTADLPSRQCLSLFRSPHLHSSSPSTKQMEGISANQSTLISNDAISQVLGKEHQGRVRGLGGGITPVRVNASVVGKQTTTQLREEIKKQNKRHEDEMNTLKQQLQDL